MGLLNLTGLRVYNCQPTNAMSSLYVITYSMEIRQQKGTKCAKINQINRFWNCNFRSSLDFAILLFKTMLKEMFSDLLFFNKSYTHILLGKGHLKYLLIMRFIRVIVILQYKQFGHYFVFVDFKSSNKIYHISTNRGIQFNHLTCLEKSISYAPNLTTIHWSYLSNNNSIKKHLAPIQKGKTHFPPPFSTAFT